MSDNADEEKYAVLDQAAQLMAGAGGPPGERGAAAPPAASAAPGPLREAVGDLTGFLHAYYRHVAAEDVAAYGAEQLAAVAAQHAALAAERPQGRPLVRVAGAGRPARPRSRRSARDAPSSTLSRTTCRSWSIR